MPQSQEHNARYSCLVVMTIIIIISNSGDVGTFMRVVLQSDILPHLVFASIVVYSLSCMKFAQLILMKIFKIVATDSPNVKISPHHSPHLRFYHLSLTQLFIPDLKLIFFTNPFILFFLVPFGLLLRILDFDRTYRALAFFFVLVSFYRLLFFLFLGDIAESDFAYWYRCYVPFSVCLSVTIVYCAQTAEDIDPMPHVSPRSH